MSTSNEISKESNCLIESLNIDMFKEIMIYLALVDIPSLKNFAISYKRFYKIYLEFNLLWQIIWKNRYQKFHKYIDILWKHMLPFITWNNNTNIEGNPSFYWNSNYGLINPSKEINYKELIKLVSVRIPIYLTEANSNVMSDALDKLAFTNLSLSTSNNDNHGYFLKIDEEGKITDSFTITKQSSCEIYFHFSIVFSPDKWWKSWEGDIALKKSFQGNIYYTMQYQRVFYVLRDIPLITDPTIPIYQTNLLPIETELMELLRFKPIYPKKMFCKKDE